MSSEIIFTPAPTVVIESPKNTQLFDANYFAEQTYIPLNFTINVKEVPKSPITYKIVIKNLKTNKVEEYQYKQSLSFKNQKILYVIDPTLPDANYQVIVRIVVSNNKGGTLFGESKPVNFKILKAGIKDIIGPVFKVPIFLETLELPPPSSQTIPSPFPPPVTPQVPAAVQPTVPSGIGQPPITPIQPPVPVVPPAPPQFVPGPGQPKQPLPPEPPKVEIIFEDKTINVEKLTDKNNSVVFNVPNMKPYLYQGEKNKVLFTISKFLPVVNYNYFNINEIKNKIGFEKILYSILENELLKQTTAIIYRIDFKPVSIEDIVNEQSIYNVLNISRNELSFNNYLDVNKDYYFLVEGKHISNSGLINLKNYSNVMKIKIIKDEELYFLETEAFAEVLKLKIGQNFSYSLNPYNKVDKQKTKKLLNKVFVEPTFELKPIEITNFNASIYKNIENKLFNINNSLGFNSSGNSKYIKLRITSKKSNKKLDINLNYNFIPTLQTNKYIEELNGKIVTKLEFYVSLSGETKKKLILGESVEFFQILVTNLEKYVQEYNTKNKKNIQIVLGKNKDTEIRNLDGPIEFLTFMLDFIPKYKYTNEILKYFEQFVK